MDSSSAPQPLRRRSSVAYDPVRDKLRDTLTGNPDTRPSTKRDMTDKDPVQAPIAEPAPTTSTSTPPPSSKPIPKSDYNLPRVPKRPREEDEVDRNYPSTNARREDHRDTRPPRRSRSPPPPRHKDQDRRRDRDRERDRDRDRNIYSRRSPPRRRTPPRDPSPMRRSPSPIRRSPPRNDQHRPGGRQGRGRNVQDQMDKARREREARQNGPQYPPAANRGVQDVSNQFYNQRTDWVKAKGRDWRKNDSKIKGLRPFNNWIKSVIIQKFSPEEKEDEEAVAWGQEPTPKEVQKPLRILDVGCGKGGDLGKWDKLPTPLEIYVGLDPAEISIQQAGERYNDMGRQHRRDAERRRTDESRPFFDGRFYVKDCFGQSIADIGIINQIGFDPNVGNGVISRFGGGGFDVVTMMFSMHYAFESEEKVRIMLKNVAGSLKKGGRFIGVVPNSDALADNVKKWFDKGQPEPEANGSTNGRQESQTENPDDNALAWGPSWGNSIYSVRFPPPTEPYTLKPAEDGSIQFRPPFGWRYTYWMAEAVDVPEFVVPWEAFRAIAEGYNLEQRYRKGFLQIWEEEKYDPEMWQLAARMGVTDVGKEEVKRIPPGDSSVRMVMSEDEKEAVGFYHAFCFVKV